MLQTILYSNMSKLNGKNMHQLRISHKTNKPSNWNTSQQQLAYLVQGPLSFCLRHHNVLQVLFHLPKSVSTVYDALCCNYVILNVSLLTLSNQDCSFFHLKVEKRFRRSFESLTQQKGLMWYLSLTLRHLPKIAIVQLCHCSKTYFKQAQFTILAFIRL